MNRMEIQHHIRAVSQTKQITRAMYLIASSKLRRAVDRSAQNHSYLENVHHTIGQVLSSAGSMSHPYLEQRSTGRHAYVVIAADKGMAGGYNRHVLELADQRISEHGAENCTVFTVGQIAGAHFARRGMEVDVEFMHVIQNPMLFHAREIAATLMQLYDMDLLDSIYVIHTEVLNSFSMRPAVMHLLPLRAEDFADEAHEASSNMIFEPSPKELFNTLAPQYLLGMIYGALVQSYASEQSARMMAMESATRNADEMVQKLTTQLQRARQAAITQEIAEIMSGAQALEGGLG